MFESIKKLFGRSSADFKTLIEKGALIVDVRTAGEYSSGHLRGSRNIPLDRLKEQVAALKALHKPVITVCKSGARSAMAKMTLAKAGIEVHNGGSWLNLKDKLGVAEP